MMPHRTLIFLCLLVSVISAQLDQKPVKRVSITAAEEKLRDTEGYAAIKELHSQMDDDKSGFIDRVESSDFLKVDLEVAGKDRAVRENAFHLNNDESVTVDDLWEHWFESIEREWSTQDMINWITNIVRLPQYVENISTAKCTGISLPRIALKNSSYLTEILKIKNPVHRQKIQLKALDVVLFGLHSESTLKDIALAILAASFISLAAVFVSQRRNSRQKLAELENQLGELNTLERNFDNNSSDDLEQLQTRLREMEQQLDAQSTFDPNGAIQADLQPLLRLTYEKELNSIMADKTACLKEMHAAKEFVDRMRRKQSSFMQSLKLATGTTSATEDVDSKIYRLKERMENVKADMAEMHNRYMQMENILGFQIISPWTEEHGFTSSLYSSSNSVDGSTI